jgi:ATP-dependent DNA helicase DinG
MRDLLQYNHHGSFRPHQKETIEQILDIIEKGEKHNIVISAPVGSGKSSIAYVTAKYLSETMSGWKNYLLSSQLMLLDQYSQEFSGELAEIRGGDNYNCSINQKSYPEGPCHTGDMPKKKLPCYPICEYIQAKEAAKAHNITLSNFHFMLLAFDFTKQFGQRDLAIFDEAHNIEGIMMDYRSVNIDSRTIKKLNDLVHEIMTGKSEMWIYCRKWHSMSDMDPLVPFDIDQYAELIKDEDLKRDTETFYKEIFPVFVELLLGVIQTIDGATKMKYREIKDMNFDLNEVEYEMAKSGFGKARRLVTDLERVCCKFSNFKKDYERTEWVVDLERDKEKKPVGIIVKPVKVDYLTKDTLLRMGKFRVFMSATVCGYERFCANIGLDLEDTVYIETPSTFPIENRPFYYHPIAKMNYTNMQSNLGKITEYIDELLNENKGVKGIVHSVSYKNAQFIKDHSKNKGRILIHDSQTKNQVLSEFYKSKDKVLISPSITEGLDLKGDLSRFQVLIKTPFLSLGDKQIARRLEIDSSWYSYMAIMTIIQSTGRSCRSETDSCKTYFLDGNFERLYEYSEEMFTKDFQDSIVWPS